MQSSPITFDDNFLINIDSLTPLMLICKQEAYPSQIDDVINMVKLLLEQGGVVNVRDKTGCTPFMYACAFGNNDIVDLLLNLSAIDATDNFGKTVATDSFVPYYDTMSFYIVIFSHCIMLSRIDTSISSKCF